MAAERQISIRMAVDTSSVTTQVPQAVREFDRLGESTVRNSRQATRSLGELSVSLRDIVLGSAGLTVVSGAIRGITEAITAIPRAGLDFSKEVEVSQMGMAGILASMTAINGQQTTFRQGMSIGTDMIRKLNDDALRTAATSQELVGVFQALLAPGLSARMTLDQIRELTVVGTNAVKSLGLSGYQVVQELRDLVAGGITAAGSSLATALGLKDSDIAAAKASSEGLFAFLMKRLKGFKDSSDAFGNTLQGKLDQLKEGATRAAAEGMAPLIEEMKEAVEQSGKLFQSVDAAGKSQLNPEAVKGIRQFSQSAASALSTSRDLAVGIWEHREAIAALGKAYLSVRIGMWAADAVASMRAYGASVVAAQAAKSQAERVAAMEAAASTVAAVEASIAADRRAAALVAEARAQQVMAQSDAASTAAKVANLTATNEAIVLSRAEVLAKMEAARATVAQAEAQIAAARAAGAQSIALALVRDGVVALTAAQARLATLTTELATLGQQQARVAASIAAATDAQAVATNAAASATARLQALQAANAATSTAATTATASAAGALGGATIAARGFGAVVAGLGGWVGIGIVALTSLGMWLWSVKGNADRATASLKGVAEARDALSKGQPVRGKYVQSIQNELESAKDELEALESRRPNIAPNATAQKRFEQSVDAAKAKVAEYSDLFAKAQTSSETANKNVTLTVEATEQAWRKANAEVKTASSIQEEYKQKLQASQSAFATFRDLLVKQGVSQKVIDDRTKRQAENEAGLAKERDKQLKALAGNSEATATRATRRSIDAQIEGVREGYKLMALQTADGLDAIDSLRKRDLLSEYGAVQRRRELQLEDLANREAALKRELELAKGDKDSAKKQEGLTGQIREVQQQRVNVNNKSDRDLEEVLAAPQLSLLNTTRQATEAIHEQAAAQEAQNIVHVKTQEAVAKITSAQDALNAMQNQSKAALIDLNIAQMERLRTDLEATDSVIPGYIEMLEKQIAAEKRLRQAVSASEGLEKTDEIRKKQLDEARKTSEDIRGVFRQGVMDALDNNGNAFASIGTSLKRTVVTALADAFYDATIKQAVDSLSQTITQALKGTSGTGAANGGGSGGGLLGALWSGVSTFLGFGAKTPTPNAKGGAYAAAGLSAYSSTLVDKPTLFPFAKGGIGLMGEAGTEGIFPLRRDSQGRLGVIGSGAGETTALTFAPTNIFHIDSQVDRGAVMADLSRAMQVNNDKQFAGLQRLKVAPR